MTMTNAHLDLAERLHNTSPEQHLIDTVKDLLYSEHRSPGVRLDRNNAPKKTTRWEQGKHEGMVQAYLDAILSIRAGSAYYNNTRDSLRVELLTQAISEADVQ